MFYSQTTLKKQQGPVIESGLCRCCGLSKKCRILTERYIHNGYNEVYIDMMMDCFGLLLSNIDGEEADRLICAQCVVKLREALKFKFQVLKCEELLLKTQDELSLEINIKIEPEETINTDSEPLLGYGDFIEKDLKQDKEQNEAVPWAEVASPQENKSQQVKDKKSKLVIENKSKILKKSEKKMNKLSAQELLKRDLYKSQQKLKKLLNNKITDKSKLKTTPAILKTAPQLDEQHYKELKSLSNLVTLVKYSYVCPFKNRTSNYYCYYCKQIYTDPKELRDHTLEHSPQDFQTHFDQRKKTKLDITKINCRLCSENINTIDSLKRHLTSTHDKKYHENCEDKFIKFKLNDDLECLECSKKFAFIDKLIEHMSVHFGKYVCEICGMCFIEEPSVNYHMRTHNKVANTFPCHKCGKELKSNYSRALHVATVHEKRPIVPCYKCDSTFLSYAQRTRHLINIHGDNRRYPCAHCNKVFDVRKTMIEHVRKYHAPVIAKHECEDCGHRFVSLSGLKDHVSSHGEGSFSCQFCDKTYKRRQSLLDHLKTHMDVQYKCNVCCADFVNDDSLRDHVKCHQSFEGLSYIM